MSTDIVFAMVIFAALMATPAVLLAYGCGQRDAREREQRERGWPVSVADHEARAVADELNELDRLHAARLVYSERQAKQPKLLECKPTDKRLARFDHLELRP